MYGRALSLSSKALARQSLRAAATRVKPSSFIPFQVFSSSEFGGVSLNGDINLPRYFASKGKGKGKGNKGKGGGGGKSSNISLRFVRYEDQLDEEPEDFDSIMQVPSNASLKDIYRKGGENFGIDFDDATLEYLDNDGIWKELTNPGQLQGIQKHPIAIRDPHMFDDDDPDDFQYDSDSNDRFDDDDDDDYDDFLGQKYQMKEVVFDLVNALRQEGAVPQPDGTLKMASDTVFTREWILKMANQAGNEDLQDFIITKIGALDHLVQCIHMEFVWKLAKEQEDKAKNEALTTGDTDEYMDAEYEEKY